LTPRQIGGTITEKEGKLMANQRKATTIYLDPTVRATIENLRGAESLTQWIERAVRNQLFEEARMMQEWQATVERLSQNDAQKSSTVLAEGPAEDEEESDAE
jgi:hypothetical protein